MEIFLIVIPSPSPHPFLNYHEWRLCLSASIDLLYYRQLAQLFSAKFYVPTFSFSHLFIASLFTSVYDGRQYNRYVWCVALWYISGSYRLTCTLLCVQHANLCAIFNLWWRHLSEESIVRRILTSIKELINTKLFFFFESRIPTIQYLPFLKYCWKHPQQFKRGLPNLWLVFSPATQIK
jgi:hypothetical protein